MNQSKEKLKVEYLTQAGRVIQSKVYQRENIFEEGDIIFHNVRGCFIVNKSEKNKLFLEEYGWEIDLNNKNQIGCIYDPKLDKMIYFNPFTPTEDLN